MTNTQTQDDDQYLTIEEALVWFVEARDGCSRWQVLRQLLGIDPDMTVAELREALAIAKRVQDGYHHTDHWDVPSITDYYLNGDD